MLKLAVNLGKATHFGSKWHDLDFPLTPMCKINVIMEDIGEKNFESIERKKKL